MATTSSAAPIGGRSCTSRPEPPTKSPPGWGPDGSSGERRKQIARTLPQPRRGGKARPPALSSEAVYDGLRYLGEVRDLGRQFEAWAGPGRETLGRFASHRDASQAVVRHDLEQRGGRE